MAISMIWYQPTKPTKQLTINGDPTSQVISFEQWLLFTAWWKVANKNASIHSCVWTLALKKHCRYGAQQFIFIFHDYDLTSAHVGCHWIWASESKNSASTCPGRCGELRKLSSKCRPFIRPLAPKGLFGSLNEWSTFEDEMIWGFP